MLELKLELKLELELKVGELERKAAATLNQFHMSHQNHSEILKN